MTKHPAEVDIVFVGGGTTACVTAGRLAAANPGLSIILIEQGPNNLGDPSVLTPGFFLSHLAPNSNHTLFWKGNKAPELNGREPIVASGGTLGGGSSINIMTYARGAASDYDDWNTPGWSSKDVIPLMKKYETYHLAPELGTHGYEGPINISYSGYYSTVAQEYLDVCVKRGIPRFDDIMDFKTGFGCQKGQRQDAAHRYIHTQSDNKHLHILAQTLVTRVLFDGNKAIGVEVIGNKNQVTDADQTPRTILARKLVVVSAGAIGSPIILQRSGVGDATRLSRLGVAVVSDLPGLGASYEDHGLLMSIYHVADDADTLDPFLGQEPGLMEGYMAEYAQGRGVLSSNACDGMAKLRPTDEEVKDMGTFGAVWKRYYEPAPDKAVIIQTIVSGFPGPRAFAPEKKRFITLTTFAGYPLSRGHVYIDSTDPYAPPDFESGFMKEQADVDAHVWGYKKAREAARRMPCYRGEYILMHPKFPEGSAAACVSLDGPPSPNVEDFVYSADDNAAIEEYVRQFGETTWHSLGTIPMKPKDKRGCVDNRLNVYGTAHLKVADLSIVPGNVGANTNSTALMIGEKAAVLIAEDLGLNTP